MEYVPGGDFRTLLNNSGVLKEEHARFYISEMFAAVNELHKLGYIHRDLKPEVSIMISILGADIENKKTRTSLLTGPDMSSWPISVSQRVHWIPSE
jgi:serine/threonine protein kinase